ncbi:MAG: hypothetical protein Q8K93_17580 [Reyranella sp.]|uniref:hypothetical protein n=1 Tax=Reyranella sp. TaxID=1929291 RepID=UPI0027322057|nr:hypothetical protein [Reyranella sp.]MDP1964002.1 hypothetical protein [Reyranella sp.]MDP2376551.1 hypothetical protein [Reyranella sp.]
MTTITHFHKLSPVWPVPVEAARALAPEVVAGRLLGLEAAGVTFRQTAMMMVIRQGLVAEILFDRPAPDGALSLRFQTPVHLRENG